MSDYRIDGPLDSELSRSGATGAATAATDVLEELNASGPDAKVQKTLDKAEELAARRLGALKAHDLRQKADEALLRGRSLYGQARDVLDDQLAVAPYRTVGLAAFAGLLAGVLLTPRKKKIVYVRSR